jgi:hypothetical protein
MQERLERQQQDNEEERARLQALITKLELQLTEQIRQTEEVRNIILLVLSTLYTKVEVKTIDCSKII